MVKKEWIAKELWLFVVCRSSSSTLLLFCWEKRHLVLFRKQQFVPHTNKNAAAYEKCTKAIHYIRIWTWIVAVASTSSSNDFKIHAQHHTRQTFELKLIKSVQEDGKKNYLPKSSKLQCSMLIFHLFCFHSSAARFSFFKPQLL